MNLKQLSEISEVLQNSSNTRTLSRKLLELIGTALALFVVWHGGIFALIAAIAIAFYEYTDGWTQAETHLRKSLEEITKVSEKSPVTTYQKMENIAREALNR